MTSSSSRTSSLVLGALLLPLATASAQSWEQRALGSGTEPKLPSGVAATDTTFAYGQPQFDPWGNSGNVDQVRVWELQNGAFVETAVLTSELSPASHGSFGSALDMEGDLLIVGDPAAIGPGFVSGVVHVYRRAAGVWTLDEVLRPTQIELSALEFGASLDLEGNRLLIGAPTSTVATNSLEDGAVYVFEDQGSGFVEIERIDNPDPQFFGGFGRDLALDGDRVLIGAPGGFQAGDGTAYLFDLSGASASLTHTFLPSTSIPFGAFGTSVALDGAVAAVGSPDVQITSTSDGRVTIFEDQSGWTETAILEDVTGLSYNRFGRDLEFEGGSLFTTSQATSSAHRYDNGASGWERAESYITLYGLTWGPKTNNRVRSIAGRVILSDPGGATVFSREVVAELEVNCDGEPHPTSATGFPVLLDVKGQVSLSEPTLPMTITKDSLTGNGILFYGFAPTNKPFSTSATLCVQGPVVRAMRIDPSASSFDLDLQSAPISGSASAIPAGTDAYFQYWFRVPGAATTHLSNSLRMVFAP